MSKRVVGRPFKKGQSGNPGGRPKHLVEVTELAKQEAPEALRHIVEIAKSSKTPAQTRFAAAQYIVDRAIGKPRQTVDTNLNAGAAFLDLVRLINATSVAESMADEQERSSDIRDRGVAGHA